MASKPRIAKPKAPNTAQTGPLPKARQLVFSANCTNDHGTFAKGDPARGAFSPALVESYLKAGVLRHVESDHDSRPGGTETPA